MASPFDALQELTFDATLNLMGVDASWTAQDKGASYSGKVHFKNPTQVLKQIGVEYDPQNWEIEYHMDAFQGLFERVEKRETKEQITVDGVVYWVTDIDADWDGKTFTAKLKLFKD